MNKKNFFLSVMIFFNLSCSLNRPQELIKVPPLPQTQAQKPKCDMSFSKTKNLKQIAFQAAAIFESCDLTEDELVTLMKNLN